MAQTRRFDPEAHLTKQGWKGKGTALKHGHLTRPLPVVVKKTMSGVGKDRDEAVPFWDNIFAATAASILSSSTPGSSNASPAVSQPASPVSTSVEEIKSRTTLSTSARLSREIARRGLYSRFFRGKPTTPEVEDEVEADVSITVTHAGPSTIIGTTEDIVESRRTLKGKEKETDREERRARRLEKVKRKEEKEARRARKAEKAEEKAKKERVKETKEEPEIRDTNRKRRKDADEDIQGGDVVIEVDLVDPSSSKEKKKKRKTKG